MSLIIPRQQIDPSGPGDSVDDLGLTDDWWWYAIKWAIIAGIFFVFILFFVSSYMHAKKRMQRGLPLMGYHRWLVPRSQRMRYERERNGEAPQYAAAAGGYHMQSYGPPPPAYNPETDYVPPYAPPEPGSKMKTNSATQEQDISAQGQEPGVASPYAPPAGPPSGPSRDPAHEGGDLGESSLIDRRV